MARGYVGCKQLLTLGCNKVCEVAVLVCEGERHSDVEAEVDVRVVGG